MSIQDNISIEKLQARERERRLELTEIFRRLCQDISERQIEVTYADPHNKSDISAENVVIGDMCPVEICGKIEAKNLLILDPEEIGIELYENVTADFAVIQTPQLTLYGDVNIRRGIIICDDIRHYLGEGETRHLASPSETDMDLIKSITEVIGERYITCWHYCRYGEV